MSGCMYADTFFCPPFEIQCQAEIVPLLIKTCCLNECMFKFSFICPMGETSYTFVFFFVLRISMYIQKAKKERDPIGTKKKEALISIVCVYLYSPARRQADDGTLEAARSRCCVWLLCVSSPH